MPKVVSALELPLQPKAPGVTLADWLSAEIVAAIRDGRLQPGTRLPGRWRSIGPTARRGRFGATNTASLPR